MTDHSLSARLRTTLAAIAYARSVKGWKNLTLGQLDEVVALLESAIPAAEALQSRITELEGERSSGGLFTGVKQQHRDDCVAACVASVFSLPLDSVPRFNPEAWGEELDKWLSGRGYGFINVSFTGEQKDGVPRGYTIGAIPTRSSDLPDGWMHSVVCLDGMIIWDPLLGEQPGTQRAREYTVVYRLRPHPQPADMPAAPLSESRLVEAVRGLKWNDGQQLIASSIRADALNEVIVLIRRHFEGKPAVAGKPLEIMTRDELLNYIRRQEAKQDVPEVEKARRNGFVQGQAWACAVMLRYELDEDQLLKESGLTAESMTNANVDPYDQEPILAAPSALQQPKQVEANDTQSS